MSLGDEELPITGTHSIGSGPHHQLKENCIQEKILVKTPVLVRFGERPEV